MKKRIFYTESAYLIGLVLLAFGTALTERADFGVSMVVAPAYLLHLKLSALFPFFSFGMAEYTLQALLLIAMMILLRKVDPTYFFSFITAVLYGLLLDGSIALIALFPAPTFAVRLVLFFVAMPLVSFSVSLLFHTYIPPEAYELFVKEVSAHFHVDIHKFKTAYDCISCLVSIALSFLFFGFGHFEGIGPGTIFTAVFNGFLIGRCTAFLEKHFTFTDRFRK